MVYKLVSQTAWHNYFTAMLAKVNAMVKIG